MRTLRHHGHNVTTLTHLPRRGIAEQRDFLFNRSTTQYSLFLDDDVILEPYVIANMVSAIKEEKCGFVGQAVLGLSYSNDIRPHEQTIEFWKAPVRPEKIRPHTKKWLRHKLHNAANVLHVQESLGITPEKQKKYKVAWIGGCILYDTKKLRGLGGYSFWKALPQNHCGEDALVQIKLMEQYGGCGLLPSGVYHQELVTTLPDRSVNAPEVFLS